jgi:hypothetical protein
MISLAGEGQPGNELDAEFSLLVLIGTLQRIERRAVRSSSHGS